MHFDGDSWSRYEQLEGEAYRWLYSLWLNDEGTRGWAVGARGEILRFEDKNWSRHGQSVDLTKNDLQSLWLNDEGTEGWAVGARDEILHFVDNSWSRYKQSAGVAGNRLYSLWLNDAGTEGWAVGARGEIWRFKDQNWSRYKQFAGVTDNDLRSLWLNDAGTEGWAVGKKGEILVFTILKIATPTFKAMPNSMLERLQGKFRITFADEVEGRIYVQIRNPQTGDIELSGESFLRASPVDGSKRVFEIEFRDIASAMANKGMELELTVTATFANAGDRDLFSFAGKPFKTVPEAPEDPWKKTTFWSIVFVIVVIGANFFLVFLATRYRWARSVILHPAGAKAVGLFVGKWAIIDPLIRFVGPVRTALFQDYRQELGTVKGLQKWTKESYVPPEISVAGTDMDLPNETEAWRAVLQHVLASPCRGAWLVQGVSGLGKTALLENMALAALKLGETPFLIRLGSSLSADKKVCALMSQFGHLPFTTARASDVEMADHLLSRGRFLILLDALNEDGTPDHTREFIRRMAARNVVIITSQTKPKWKDIDLVPIELKPFGPKQLEKILPNGWLDRVLEAKYLVDSIQLAEPAKQLARYLKNNNILPPSLLAIYESLCKPIIKNPKLLNLEEVAWQTFCENTDRFEPSNAIPEDEICEPVVESGLLTVRQEGDKTLYKFAHEREHRYLVARYLSRQEPKQLEEWHEELKPGLGHAFWADVLEFWGAMKAERSSGSNVVHTEYREFLKDVAAFEPIVFAEWLYPQYERLRESGKIPQDPLFESWVDGNLAGASARSA